MPASMFERYGGFARVSRVVSGFYDKVLDSPTLSPYFANVDMKRLIDHQTKFIAYIMGGPASYTNDALLRAHARLNIDQKSFDEAIALLRETLEDFDFDEVDIVAIEKGMKERRDLIVTKG